MASVLSAYQQLGAYNGGYVTATTGGSTINYGFHGYLQQQLGMAQQKKPQKPSMAELPSGDYRLSPSKPLTGEHVRWLDKRVSEMCVKL